MANPYGMMCTVTDDPKATKEAALRKLRKIAAERRRAAVAEDGAVVEALRIGNRQAEVARAIERSREHVRLIAREAGIESNRPPTAGRHPDPSPG